MVIFFFLTAARTAQFFGRYFGILFDSLFEIVFDSIYDFLAYSDVLFCSRWRSGVFSGGPVGNNLILRKTAVQRWQVRSGKE